jgi:hypothetical protein
MQVKTAFEHVALLSLMMTRVLTRRLQALGQLDSTTTKHLHHLVVSMKTHADLNGNHELDVLLGEMERELRAPASAEGP